MAVSNGLGAVAGIVGPTFAGFMTPDSTLHQWRTVFWVSFGVYAFRTIVYSLWASGKLFFIFWIILPFKISLYFRRNPTMERTGRK